MRNEKESGYIIAWNLLKKSDPHHGCRVREKCIRFAEILNLNDKDIDLLSNAALFHDIGKSFIAPGILNKPGVLSAEERIKIEEHPIFSESIIQKLEFDQKDKLLKIIRHHHENYDGSGYPDNISGEQIPYLSRLIFIVDTFDALISIRPYREKVYSIDEAKEIMAEQSGIRYDPKLLIIFLNNIDRILLKEDFVEKRIS